MDYGANVNEFCNGATPLILLSRAGSVVNQLETVEFLLKRGANIALTDLVQCYLIFKSVFVPIIDFFSQHGQTCLHAAALKGNLLLVKFLCEYGADPDAKDSQVVCRVFLIGNSVGVKFLRKVIREGLQLKKFLEVVIFFSKLSFNITSPLQKVHLQKKRNLFSLIVQLNPQNEERKKKEPKKERTLKMGPFRVR